MQSQILRLCIEVSRVAWRFSRSRFISEYYTATYKVRMYKTYGNRYILGRAVEHLNVSFNRNLDVFIQFQEATPRIAPHQHRPQLNVPVVFVSVFTS